MNQSNEAATDVFRVVPDAAAANASPRGVTSPRGDGRLQRLRNSIRAALASYRLRIVGWFIALLALGTLATILVVGQLLFQRIDNGVGETLLREAKEFQLLANGNDPVTGQPFGSDVSGMFDAYIERHFPGPNDMSVTSV